MYLVGTGEICIIIALAVRCTCDALARFVCDSYFAKGLQTLSRQRAFRVKCALWLRSRTIVNNQLTKILVGLVCVDCDFAVQATIWCGTLKVCGKYCKFGWWEKVGVREIAPPAKVITFADLAPPAGVPTWAVSAVHSLISLPYLAEVEPPQVLRHHPVLLN